MVTPFRIARLHSRLQLPSGTPEQGTERVWLQALSERSLPRALDGVAERALSRAGLAPEAVVAVGRIELHLKVPDGTSDDDLLRTWSQALEQALVLALGRASQVAGPTECDLAEQVVVFADAWAAEMAHLGELLRQGQPAWWADRLLDGRGEPLDLAPVAILHRWLERQPARAAALMVRLAELQSTVLGVGELLPEPEAGALAEVLAQRLSQRPAAELAMPEVGTPLRALLATSLEHLRGHRQLGRSSSALAPCLAPWRLALLLHRQPTLAVLSPPTLLAVVESLEPVHLSSEPETVADPQQLQADHSQAVVASEGQRAATSVPGESLGTATTASPDPAQALPTPPEPRTGSNAPIAQTDSYAPVAAGADQPTPHSTWIHAGGLMLLLNRPELAAPAGAGQPESAPAGDLALLAVQRLVAPLAAGERTAALQRERPLLALLAPDRVWPEPLDQARVADPKPAERQLAGLITTIPEGIGFAPGALRQVYGPRHGATPPLPDQDTHRLAALLWRPGLLTWDDWEISLTWPLACVDGALRRGGWDLDPGWQPSLRRVVRFHYRSEVGPPQEERP
jgi:hypothetical protein